MKFERPKGFMGSAPRNWVDKSLPVCPFCHRRPLWETAMEFKWGWNRYHFRCPLCMAIFSIPVVDVAGPGADGMWLLRKATQKQTVLKVESVGNNQDAQDYVGKEIPLENLQQMAGAQAFCGQCGTAMATDEKFCAKCGAKKE